MVVEVTGTIDFAAGIALDAIDHGKDVVIVNAELDSLVGPLLKAKRRPGGRRPDEHGRRRARRGHDALPLRALPRAAARGRGNIKGMVDHYRNPDTQRAFAEKNDQDARKVTSFADATKLSMETTVLANATGFRVGRRGMFGPACDNVSDLA